MSVIILSRAKHTLRLLTLLLCSAASCVSATEHKCMGNDGETTYGNTSCAGSRSVDVAEAGEPTGEPINTHANVPFIPTRKTTPSCVSAESEIKALAVRDAIAAEAHYNKLMTMSEAEVLKLGKDNAANRDTRKNSKHQKLRDANSKLILDWIKTCTSPENNEEEEAMRSIQAICLFLETGYYVHLPMGSFPPETKASIEYSFKKHPQPANDPKELETFSQYAQARLCR
ncbi:hypothetical protein [Simiduia litorea]|uniref:hypothetical protein n=1 Tax=Simiduia litorea TaxID=1435348 RepID=UPI0036F1C6B9